MNLRLERGEIALPKDFKFDIQSNHPFFSDEGTASVPVTLPPTPENRALLNHPENQHSARRFTRQLPAQLSHGIYTKRCQLIIDAASQKGGISCSLALQESEMYADIQDRRLPDVFASGTTVRQSGIPGYLNGLTVRTSGDYVCLPVAADAVDADEPDDTGSKKRITTVLNAMTEGSLNFAGGNITVGDETVAAPAYYGIALFMPLSAMLRKMFEYSFYTVVENVFDTDPVLSQIVVLHNTADAVVGCITGSSILRVREADMVPSVTVGEMIEWIRVKFGAFCTVEGKRVSIRLIRDVLSMDADLDLSAYMGEDCTLQHPDPRMIRYSCQHDIEGSEPAAETLEDLRARYSSIVDCTDVSQIAGTGLFHVAPLGKYYYRQTQDSQLTTAMIGTDAFDYYRKKDMETEEMAADDSFVPMVLHNGAYMPFIGGTVRRHIDTSDKETDAEQPLMITYVRNDGIYNYGTPYRFLPDGTGDDAHADCPDLTPEQLAPHFFSAWRDLLLNAAPTLTCELSLPLTLLTTMDPWTPKLLNHTRVLIRSLKYSISDSGTSSCEAELQLLPSYADAETVSNPDPFSSNLGWRRKDTRRVYPSGDVGNRKANYTEITGTDGLADYTAADAPSYTPGYPGTVVMERQRWVTVHRHTYSHRFLRWDYDDFYYTHYYTEYFESYNQE